ncbi:TPA: hypothetical protein ACX3KG_006148 [Raoultella ornithinolytica]|uniref:hypothetical protein n=1 Tax=Raoultella ornithinolytica TaxID=54291 RepID=UPI00297051AA|nr:hypothetical protein [Raoultella ornithinolytica]HAV2049093.1 hypothetical protein [Raoultella ornithinolytica]HAV2054672.1 hypothetical protein [Raoultella ornithinolytica]
MVKFSLLENALDSVETGLEHFYQAAHENNNRDYKRCLLDLFQGAELLLKATLTRIDETLIFEDWSIKKMCGNDRRPTEQELYRCKSVGIAGLRKLVEKQYPEEFGEGNLKLLDTLAFERNKIQHFAIEISPASLAMMLRELYLKVYKPAFAILQADEAELSTYDSEIKEKIVDFERQFLNIDVENEYHLAMCPACESWSHFILYRGKSYPVETYCTCCDFRLDNLLPEDHHLCPECGAASVIYITERQKGACLWYKCDYSSYDGFLTMEPCTCGGYKIEGKCRECD